MSGNEKNKNWFMVIVAVIVCFAFAGLVRAGTPWPQRQKLLASDGAAGDYFGWSVSISGDLAIVGAYDDDDKGSDSGSAYIFRWDGASWVQQQKLTASDGNAGDNFGYSVSISDDYAIVGAYGDDVNGTDSGSAYIFRWDGTSWVQQAKLTASDGAYLDYFGISVSISGNLAIVGAYDDDDKGTDSGSAYIFRWDGTSWVQQKLIAADGAAYDYFGWSVSIGGDYAIVGAIYDDDRGTNSGSAYIFKWNGTSWSQQAKITASDGAIEDYFGYSVSISGDYAIVGRVAMTTKDLTPAQLIYSNGMGRTGTSSKSLPPLMALPLITLAFLFLLATIMQSWGRIEMTTEEPTPARLIYSGGIGQAGFSRLSSLPQMELPTITLAGLFLSAAIMQSWGQFTMTTEELTPARLMCSGFARRQTLMITVRWISLTLQSLPIGGYTEPIK